MTPGAPPRRQLLVTGATGLVGQALVAAAIARGDRVLALARDPARARRILDRGEVRCIQRLDELPDDTPVDAVVHLAGARVLDRRWTPARKEVLERSRLGIAAEILRLLGRLAPRPRVLVGASAASYYGRSGAAPRTEADAPVGGGFGSELCVRIEEAAARARSLGARVVMLRLGIVLSRDGGALPPLATAARFGLAAELGSGQQPVPWIHVEDAVRLILAAVESEALDGPVNAVAPEIPSQSAFARTVAARFGRRVRLRAPASMLRLLLGERAGLLLEGQHAAPSAALRAGFVFRHPGLAGAVTDLLG